MNAKEACWCFVLDIPQSMLDLLPSNKKDAACICQSCIALYEKDKVDFQRRSAELKADLIAI